MSWWQAAPALLAQVAIWFLPGWAVLRALGVRGFLVFAGGPAVSAAVAGAWAIVADPLGLHWSPTVFILGVALAVGIAALARLTLARLSGDEPLLVFRRTSARLPGDEARLAPRPGPWRRWLAVSWLLGAAVLTLATAAGMGAPDQPAQTWDAVFHLNALWFIRDTGNATMFGALVPMFGGEERYYPSVWHSLAALTPAEPSVAGNASVLVLGSGVWIAGMVALVRAVWPQRTAPAVVVPFLAAGFVAFPVVAFSVLGVWPYAASVACLPGALALLVVALDADAPDADALDADAPDADGPPRGRTTAFLAFVGAAGGVAALHGSAVFSLLVVALPPTIGRAIPWVTRSWREGRRGRALLVAVGVPLAIVAGVGLLLLHPATQAVVTYERGGNEDYLYGLRGVLEDQPLAGGFSALSSGAVLTVLAVVGAGVAFAYRRGRWLVVVLLVCGALTVVAAGPQDGPLREITSLWFSQASRLHQLYVLAALALASLGVAAVGGGIARAINARPAVGIVLVLGLVTLATSGLRVGTHIETVAQVYTREPILYGTQLEPEEVPMVDRAATTLPEDALVLGDPAVGTPFLLHRSGVDVVFPQLSLSDQRSPQLDLLAARFDQWATDPRVCEAVRDLGITHVYVDRLSPDEGGKIGQPAPGLRGLRPVEGEGFELVDRGGHASIWEFTGCG